MEKTFCICRYSKVQKIEIVNILSVSMAKRNRLYDQTDECAQKADHLSEKWSFELQVLCSQNDVLMITYFLISQSLL